MTPGRLPNRLQEVERAHGVDVEVVERPARREVVRRLSRAVNDEIGARVLDQRRHSGSIADVDVVVLEARRDLLQATEVRGRVSVRPEELPAHVVVDAVHAPALAVEGPNQLGADQPTRAGDERALHAARSQRS